MQSTPAGSPAAHSFEMRTGHVLTTLDVANIVARSNIGPLQIRIFLICLLVTVLDGFDTQCIAFVAPSVAQDWSLTRSAFAIVFSAGLFGTMLGSLLLAPLGDKFGRKPALLISMFWFGLLSLLTPLAHDVLGLSAFRASTGLGLGMALPNAIALSVEYSSQHRRTLLTTAVVLGIALGGTLGGILCAQIIPTYGWRCVFVVGGALPLLAIPFVWIYLPESIRFLATQARSAINRTQDAATIGAILSRLDPANDYRAVQVQPHAHCKRPPLSQLFVDGRALLTCLLWVVFIVNLFMMNFMINWLPSVLHQAGLPIKQSILITIAFNVAGIVGGLILAQSVDKWGAYKILPISYLVTAVAVCSVGFVYHSPAALWVAVCMSGVGIIGSFSGVNVLSGTVYPTDIRATGVGWAFGIGRIGSVLGPIAGGVILSLEWSMRDIFIATAIPALLAAIGIIGIGRWVKPLNDDG